MARQFQRRWDFWTAGIIRPVRVIIVAVLLLILPAVGIIRDILLQPEDRNWGLLKYMPKIGWYWYAIAILVGLLVLLEETSVRAHRIGLRDQRLKHIERFRQYREQNKRPVVIIQGTPDPLNLVSSAHERRAYRDARGVIFERDAGEEQDTDFYIVTADFNNAILEKRKPGEALDVSARVVFHPFDKDKHEYVTLDRGAWLREGSGKVIFGRNDTRELVIATAEKNCLYAIKQLAVINGQKVTTRLELPEDSFDVHVRLNAELENKVIKRAHVILERTTENEAGIKLTLAYRWRYDRLGELNSVAYGLFDRAIALAQGKVITPAPGDEETKSAIEAEFLEWQNKVVDFLLKRWDNAHKQRFLPDPPKPRPDAPAWTKRIWASLEPPELYSAILAKAKILNEFQNELMTEPAKELALMK